MDAPSPDDAAVHLRLKCPDADDFVARFAPNVTRGGVFLPTHHTREVGAPIRFEIALVDGTVVFAGDGVVTWVKPKGMGVKFTTLDPASEPMLERLLARREAPAATAMEGSGAAPASPAAPAAEPRPAPATLSAAAAAARPAPVPRSASAWAHEISAAVRTGASRLPAETRPTPPAVPATSAPTITDSSLPLVAPGPRRPLVRVAVVASAVFVVVAIVWMSVGRARVGAIPPAEPVKSTAAVASAPPAVAAPAENVAPAAAPAPVPPSETPPPEAAPPPASRTRAGALHVDSIIVSSSYKKFTCPNPSHRISVRSTRTVNVCLQVAHRQGKSDRLTLVWERNGSFSGKTPLEIPASKPTARTRVHMKISAHRLGPWSVRVVGDQKAPLAQADFEVVP